MTDPVVAPPPTDATADTFGAVREALRRWYTAVIDMWAREPSFLGTFTPGVASTTFTDARISPRSQLQPQPCTANAAAAMTSWWIDEATRVRGTVTVNHANNAQVDRTFRWKICGA